MDLLEFKQFLRTHEPEEVVAILLESNFVEAFQEEQYQQFCEEVASKFEDVEMVKIMGSGNHKFSLNPLNNFKEFHEDSDIDTVIISLKEFNRVWEELRGYHRNKWYILGAKKREQLLRNGQNIYSGFVSPLWIPEKLNESRFNFIRIKNDLSNNYENRNINMLFFKNYKDVVDYYKRSVMLAKREL